MSIATIALVIPGVIAGLVLLALRARVLRPNDSPRAEEWAPLDEHGNRTSHYTEED
jgi:hypothetical protein